MTNLEERFQRLKSQHPLRQINYPDIMDSLFLGYYQGMGLDGKQCMVKRAVNEVSEIEVISQCKSLEEAQYLKSYGGILRNDILLFDMDDAEEADAVHKMLLDMGLKFISFATKKGYHFYWRSKPNGYGDGRDMVTPIIVHADFKNGCNRSVDALRKNGVENIPVNMINPADLDYLPDFLLPLECGHIGRGTTLKHKDYIPRVVGMKEDTGRGVTIFGKLRWFWKKHGYSVEQAKYFATLIDKYLFDKPLDKGQLNHIFRLDEWEKIPIDNLDKPIKSKRGEHVPRPDEKYWDKSKLRYEAVARDLFKDHKFVFLDGENLYVYSEKLKYYVSDVNYMKSLVSKYIPDVLTDSQKAEVLKCSRNTPNIDIPKSRVNPPELIPLANGVFNVFNGDFREYYPEDVYTWRLPWDYNPTAKCEKVEVVLKQLAYYDEAREKTLEEALGYPLYNSNKLCRGQAIILVGDKKSGKSTFNKLITVLLTGDTFVDDYLVTSLKIHQLADKFKTIKLKNALYNNGDDLATDVIKNIDLLKSLISGESVTAEEKMKTAESFTCRAKLYFSTNEMASFNDVGKSLSTRLKYVMFKNTFLPPDHPERREFPDAEITIPNIIEDMLSDKTCMEALTLIALKGLMRLVANDKFTDTDEDADYHRELEIENDSVEQFMVETYHNDINLILRPIQAVYEEYYMWAVKSNVPKIESRNVMVRRIKALFKEIDVSQLVCKDMGRDEAKAKYGSDRPRTFYKKDVQRKKI